MDFGLTMLSLADATADESETNPIVSVGMLLFPLLMMVSIIIVGTRYNKRQAEYLARREQHMDRIEAQSDEMIALLREIRDQNRSASNAAPPREDDDV